MLIVGLCHIINCWVFLLCYVFRFGLPDKQRKGTSVTLSPCKRLLAITDTLGRVVLVDVERGIAVRMWKGYRDAQCAWLLADDDMNSKTKALGRKALFLVIYAPRKGQLEVFAMQQGPKVATFPVNKSGRYAVVNLFTRYCTVI